MKNIFFLTAVFTLHLFNYTYAQAQSSTQVKQLGNTRIETKVYNDGKKAELKLTNGKRTYTVYPNSGEFIYWGARTRESVAGDIKLPKKDSPDYGKISGTFGKNGSKPGGVMANVILLIPEIGLVGINLPTGIEKVKNSGTIMGIVSWQLDLATGEVKYAEDQIAFFDRDYIFAKRLLYTGKSLIAGEPGKEGQTYGFLFEDNKLIQQWDNLSVMSAPVRTSNRHGVEKVKRYYRYWDGHFQLAAQKEGKTHEITIFDEQLQVKNTYFPSLLVYRNYDRMPNVKFSQVNETPGSKYVADYRQGKGLGPDELFRLIVLVPSQDIEGLYGVLQADGTVEIPEGSLGLSPVMTEEVNAKSNKETYLLSHFFIVAYPGGTDGKMKYAVAGSEGKLSFGSENDPVWTEWTIHESPVIAENNKATLVHAELLTARLPDGNWQCYLVSRYLNSNHSTFNRYENLGVYFPTPIGNYAKTEQQAISSAEEAMLRIENIAGKRKAENLAKAKAASDAYWNKYYAERDRKMEEWRRSQPVAGPRAGVKIGSSWQGFSYGSQTTQRYNRTVNQSNYNNQMRAFNNYLNNKIYGR